MIRAFASGRFQGPPGSRACGQKNKTFHKIKNICSARRKNILEMFFCCVGNMNKIKLCHRTQKNIGTRRPPGFRACGQKKQNSRRPPGSARKENIARIHSFPASQICVRAEDAKPLIEFPCPYIRNENQCFLVHFRHLAPNR